MQSPAITNDGFIVPNGDAAGYEGAANFDVREIWAAIYRSRFWIAAIFAGILVVVFVLRCFILRFSVGPPRAGGGRRAEK